MFGYDSPEEVLALPISSLYHKPSDREAFIDKLKSKKILTNHEMRFRRKGGDSVWLIANFTLVDEDSAGGGIVEGTLIDITERKRAEEELYGSRQMLQSILDAIPQRVFWKDQSCTYLGCNRAFALDAGLKTPAEIIGKTDFELAWTGMAEVYRADDKAMMEQGSAKLNFEECQTRPDGSRLWLQTNKLPMRNREGKVTGVIGTYEDITARKQRGKRTTADAIFAGTCVGLRVLDRPASSHRLCQRSSLPLFGTFSRGASYTIDPGYRSAFPQGSLV